LAQSLKPPHATPEAGMGKLAAMTKNNMQTITIYPFLVFFFMLRLASAQVDVTYNQLVWSDEFNQNGAIDPTKWHHQTQLPDGGSWYNGEVQHYTNQLKNAVVENGVLKITAIKENYTNQGVTKAYTSARLNSKVAFTNGRVDIKAKIPTQQGTWPALWLLGKNITEPGGFFAATHGNTPWPACGEIDIMEHGITPSKPTGFIQSAIHTPSSFGNTIDKDGTIANNLGNDFHVYSMNWSPNQITFLLDSVAFYTYNPSIKNESTWPFTADQYLLMNIAMGGVAGSIPSNFNRATMEIDYVRVYQNTVGTTNLSMIDFLIPNPVQELLTLPSHLSDNHVRFFNTSGQLVLHTTNLTTVDVTLLPVGLYVLVLESNNQLYRKKIIKQ
jgi:beta-glucanase (GH16 family)